MAPASRVSLGGLDFLLSANEFPLRWDDEEAYRSFLVTDPAPFGPTPPVRVQFVVSPAPSFPGHAIFRSSATWAILARGSDRALEFLDPSGDALYVAQFRPASPDITVLCAPRLLSTAALGNPFRYPLDQVLTMYLLDGAGVILHAAGALVGGKGIALAGVSGAGKSTFMRLAEGRPAWEPLSDDRVIVRLTDDSTTLHGTPWPGEGRVAENRGGPMARLFFLEQGSTNEVRPLVPGETLPRLLRTASVPWYDPEYLGNSLDSCGRILERVPSAALSFRPEADVVELVERVLASDRTPEERAHDPTLPATPGTRTTFA